MSAFEILKILWSGFPVASEFLNPDYPAILQSIGGLQLAISITLVSLFSAVLPGFLLALLRQRISSNASIFFRIIGGVFATVSTVITETIRGVPVMTLVLLFFYLPYPLFELRVPPVILAILAFTVYASVYMSEVVRSGFRAVNRDTLDAARVLGLSPITTLVQIQIPIAVRTMLPAFTNLFITVFKDTSVLTVVAVGELTYTGRQLFVSSPQNYLLILFLIVLIYWSVAFLGAKLVASFEATQPRIKKGKLS